MAASWFVVLASCALAHAQTVPSFPLYNSAKPGLRFPAIGLGTGGYSGTPVGPGVYPECWSSTSGCGQVPIDATTKWLQAGGRRIDAANSYQNQHDVGVGMWAAGVPREEIFLLSKVGPSLPLGYNDALDQFQKILSDMNTTYVDSLLIHWPWTTISQGNVSHNATESSDIYCNTTAATYNEKQCRLNTWRALVQIFNSGQALSIGVSNYNVSHFQEIIEAGLPLPALTQNPFHIYRSSSQMDVLNFCSQHGILFVGYSPLGVPDYKHYPTPALPAANQLQDPTVVSIAQAHGVTPAQVLIQWQYALGIPVNPRTTNATHMTENLNSYSFSLTQTEIRQLSSLPQDFCLSDPTWYECA